MFGPTRYIDLSRGYTAKVSEIDYDRVSGIKWWFNGESSPYARSDRTVNGKKVSTYLHRMVLWAPRGLVVNHKNGDTLDCTRGNLEAVRSRSNNTLLKVRRGAGGYSGVYFRNRAIGEDPVKRNVRAYIFVDGSKIYLGAYNFLTDAARAYDHASVSFFGDQADTNFPLSDYLTMWTPPDRVPQYDHMAEIPF